MSITQPQPHVSIGHAGMFPIFRLLNGYSCHYIECRWLGLLGLLGHNNLKRRKVKHQGVK